MAAVKVDLSDQDIANLKALTGRTGLDANTVIQQAIANAKLLSDNVADQDDLLIKKGDKFLKVNLSK